jgi:creatinine amidohydrolase/Fe(II)-dependent formamide hydrolase-like protein
MRLTAILVISAACLRAQAPARPVIEFELMTWAEVKKAIHQEGKTTVLVYNGGVEQRGPQNVNGGHNLMAAATVRQIALKLGNAITAPVLPYSVNKADPELPGTIGLTGELFAAINEQVAEQLIITGFKNVVLMGDHGGGQKELGDVAKKLDAKYSPQGIHVVFCDEVYEKAQGDYTKWLADNHYPSGGHASVMDTSEMLYLSTLNGNDRGWVRKDIIPSALGDPVGRGQRDASAPRVHNGITGDARPSTPELGKRIFDTKVDYAVRQIRVLLNMNTQAAQ